ncbi:hypothetical protein EG487_04365, partial [Paenibacillus polymyxa]
QVPRAGTFDQATLILYANEKRINQKELVDLIIRPGRIAGSRKIIMTTVRRNKVAPIFNLG